MKGRVVVLDRIGGRAAAALLVDGRLEDFLIDPPRSAPPAPGAVFRAIAERPLSGQGGMIVRLPAGARGFLRRSRALRPGQPLLVQVTSHVEAGKAVPVTTRLLIKSRYAIATPGAPGINIARTLKGEAERDRLLKIADDAAAGASIGVIVRSAADGVRPEVLADDVATVLAVGKRVMGDDMARVPELLIEAPDAHTQAWCDWATPAADEMIEGDGAFEQLGVDEMLATLASGEVALDGGASMFVEATRALVAVDVNTGADTSRAAGFRANLAAARDLPRQLRLRGLGGQVVIDPAPMPKKDRRQFEQVLKSAFRADAVETVPVGWTPLGHYEVQRKRARLPLALRPEGLSATEALSV